MKKSIAALALAGIIALAGTAPAVASTYPAPGNEQGTVSDGTIAAGESITFAGTGYIGGETINVTFERTGGKKDSEGERPAPSSFSVIADGAGAFSTSITFTDSGRYTISAVGATSGNTRWAAVTVNAGKGSSGFTGASSVTAVGANGQADTAEDSSLVLWSLVGGGALAASAASAALIRRAKAKV